MFEEWPPQYFANTKIQLKWNIARRTKYNGLLARTVKVSVFVFDLFNVFKRHVWTVPY